MNKITRAVRIIIAAAVGFILSLFAATILAAQTLNSPQSNATPQNIGNQSPSLPKVKPKKVAPLPKLMQPVKVTPQNIGNQTPSLPQVEPVQHSNIPDPDPEPSPEPGAPETNVTSLPTPSGSNVPASNLGNIPGVTPDLKAEQMQNQLDRNQIERIDHAAIQAMREAADALGAAGLREGGIDPGTGLGNRDDDGFLGRLGELGDGDGGLESVVEVPGLPDSSGDSGLAGAPTGPSQNPEDWMSGAASQTATLPTYQPRGPNNRTDFPASGGGWSESTTGGVTTYTRHVGGTQEAVEDFGDGEYLHTKFRVDKHGQEAQATLHHGDGTSEQLEKTKKGIAELQGTEGADTDETHDPDSADTDGAWARWQAGFSGERVDLSLPTPNRVDPGPDGGTPVQTAPGLKPTEEMLTGDPSLTAARQQHGNLDPETARKMLEEAKPGPGPMPEDPEEPQ